MAKSISQAAARALVGRRDWRRLQAGEYVGSRDGRWVVYREGGRYYVRKSLAVQLLEPADPTPPGNPAVYTRVRLGRRQPGRIRLKELEACIGHRSARASVVHVRGLCRDGTAFAGCLVLSEGRDQPEFDLRVYGGPQDTAALAASIEACLAEHTNIVGDEMARIGGQGRKQGNRRRHR